MGQRILKSLYLPPRLASAALGCGFVMTISGMLWGPLGWAAAGAALAISLAWASFVDIDRLILPDVITLGLVVAGLILRVPMGLAAVTPYAIGAVVGFSILAAVAVAYKHARGHAGLGMGDAKLLAAAGAWLGWTALPSVLLTASASALAFVAVSSLVLRRVDSAARIPFGPFIAAAIWIVWLVGSWAVIDPNQI
jgi:leader peptidase (prepilin peptidase)/N-methyltransferase